MVPQKVVEVSGNPIISRKSRLVKYYSIWPDEALKKMLPREPSATGDDWIMPLDGFYIQVWPELLEKSGSFLWCVPWCQSIGKGPNWFYNPRFLRLHRGTVIHAKSFNMVFFLSSDLPRDLGVWRPNNYPLVNYHRPWKMVVGRRFWFFEKAYFQGLLLLVLGSVFDPYEWVGPRGEVFWGILSLFLDGICPPPAPENWMVGRWIHFLLKPSFSNGVIRSFSEGYEWMIGGMVSFGKRC